MRDSKKLISSQIYNDIPQYIRMEYPNFVAFITAYYSWMEQEGLPYHFIANILNYADVDRTSLEFLDEFGKNFLSPLPDIIYDQNNIRTLVKNINQYYSARGSERSFEFLFRLFRYQDDALSNADIYYPSYDILRVSDGKWVMDKTIKIIDPPDDIMNYESGTVTGELYNATAVIDEIKVYQTTSDISVAEIFMLEFDVIHSAEKFNTGETVNFVDLNNNTFSAVIEEIAHSINITDAGNYYPLYQRVEIENSGTGEDAFAVIDSTTKGIIDSVTILDGGIDYEIDDKVYTMSTDFGHGAYGKVTAIDGLGSITEIKLLSGGNEYQNIPKVDVISENGTDALLIPESTSIGNVRSIDIKKFGINYLSTETTLTFNNVLRLYGVTVGFDIGENVTGQSSGATGTIEYFNDFNNVMVIRPLTGTFTAGEDILGSWRGSYATIYDTSTATGELNDGCLCNYKGRYINMDGHISSLKYIQDSYFYQMFSYMVRINEDKSEWFDYVEHVHPAGTVGFSYKEAGLYYINESSDNVLRTYINTLEFYKFRWDIEPNDIGTIGDYGNTQIKQYTDIVIKDIIVDNLFDETRYSYGSEIEII